MPRDGDGVHSLVIRTGSPGWFAVLAKAYRERTGFLFIDDASTGFDPSVETLVALGIRVGISPTDWKQALGCMGVSALGIGLIIVAVLDSEPTSKLAIITAAGAVLAVSGGLGAIHVLTRLKPPTVKVNSKGFEISWD